MIFIYMIAPAAGGVCAGIFSFINKAAQDNMKKFAEKETNLNKRTKINSEPKQI